MKIWRASGLTRVEAAAHRAEDVSVLINNAGISTSQPLLKADVDTVRREIEKHVFGALSMARAFTPALPAHQGAMASILSALSWFSYPGSGACSAAEAAGPPSSRRSSPRPSRAPAGPGRRRRCPWARRGSSRSGPR
ncbi:SDR family NAD(P)-dependent oxidoreductase [Streptomyces bungoensis]